MLNIDTCNMFILLSRDYSIVTKKVSIKFLNKKNSGNTLHSGTCFWTIPSTTTQSSASNALVFKQLVQKIAILRVSRAVNFKQIVQKVENLFFSTVSNKTKTPKSTSNCLTPGVSSLKNSEFLKIEIC